jgi:hypothetical protein
MCTRLRRITSGDVPADDVTLPPRIHVPKDSGYPLLRRTGHRAHITLHQDGCSIVAIISNRNQAKRWQQRNPEKQKREHDCWYANLTGDSMQARRAPVIWVALPSLTLDVSAIVDKSNTASKHPAKRPHTGIDVGIKAQVPVPAPGYCTHERDRARCDG